MDETQLYVRRKDEPTLYGYIKQLIALVAAGCIGFWIGANYTASLAYEAAIGVVATEAPTWVGTVQSTLWLSIGAAGLAVVGWIALDWREQ
jgi:hypothetical protein